MYQIQRAHIGSAVAVLVLSVSVLFGSLPANAQVSTPTPDPALQCTVQDNSTSAPSVFDSGRVTENADNGSVDLQCGDQTSTDVQPDTTGSDVTGASDSDTTQQQDGPQNQNDNLPETTTEPSAF